LTDEQMKINLSDNVFMGSVDVQQNIMNIGECPSCSASNVKVMKCQEKLCTSKKFCELCHTNSRFSEGRFERFDSGNGSGPLCAKCRIITKNQYEEKKRLEQERADEIRTLEFNKSELIDNITSHNNVIEEIKKQIKSENDKISWYIRNTAKADDTSLKNELKKLRIKEFEGMTADNFRAKDTIEKTLEIKSLKKINAIQLLLMALMIGGVNILIYYLDSKLDGKIIVGIIVIYSLPLFIASIAFWLHEVRIKNKLREEPFPMRLVGRYIDWSFGTSKLHVLKEKEESRILGEIKVTEELKAEIAQIPNIRSSIESLENNIANNNEEIAEIKIKIINIDKQIIVARDSIKEMIPYSDRLELE
jgi:hypothetical protein